MSSSPTGLTNDEEAGGVEIGNMFIAEDGDYDDCWPPNNLPDNNDGHNNNEHQRPSTSESCARGDEKRTRTRTSTSTDVEQSGEGGDDGNADDNSTSSSCSDDDNRRQQQEDLFASLIVTIPSNDVATIVETLLERNPRACLRVIHNGGTYKATKLKTCRGIVCDVNHIDISLLQELVKSYQGGETHCAQDKPVICCINRDSKLLIYRGEDGTPATKQLCPYGDCIKVKWQRQYGCRQHCATIRNGHTTDQMDNTDSNESNLFDDDSLHAADKPLLEQLGKKILLLAPPQQKLVADLLRQDCREAVGETNKLHNVLLKLDEIPRTCWTSCVSR